MSAKNFHYPELQSTTHAVAKADGDTAYRSVMARFGPARKLQTEASAFAPERQGNKVQSFTTGEDYFKNVCAAIENARESVFIAGWQVNWAAKLVGNTRLIDALKKAVDNGAKVYVMPWQSPKVGLDTGDLGTMLAVFQLNAGKDKLVAFCCPAGLQNDYESLEETFFSHHQKQVVIDNKIAYAGGIDLAFGRRDDAKFSLTHGWRTGPEVYNTGVPAAHALGPAEANAYVTETELLTSTLTAGLLQELTQAQTDAQKAASRSAFGKATDEVVAWWRQDMPDWLMVPINGLKANLAAPFDKAQQAAADKLIKKLEAGKVSDSDVTEAVNLVRDFIRASYVALVTMGWLNRKANPQMMAAGAQSSPGASVHTADQPRMPWQDVHVRIEGPSVYDLSQNFIRRWNSIQKSYLPDMWSHRTMITGNLLPKPPAPGKGNGGTGGVEIRVLRSAPLTLQQDEAKATKGLPKPVERQHEIHDMMVSVILRAERFIYIENQFFQSGFGKPSIAATDKTAISGPMRYLMAHSGNRIKSAVTRVGAQNVNQAPQNHIARAIAERTEKAIQNDQHFHTYMVLPVHPEGSLADLAIVGQIHWTMQSLVFASDSLVNRIRVALAAKQICKEKGQDPRSKEDWEWAKRRAQDLVADVKNSGEFLPDYKARVRLEDVNPYLTLLNLRNCQTVGGSVRTEQIYVHSKLLIVDDRVVIVGSANINDRSLNGGRDSELAVYLNDLDTMTAPIDGKNPIKVRTLAHKMRVDLWKKHFAITGANDVVHAASELASLLDKPADPATWQAIQKIAQSNLKAYKNVDWIPQNDSSIWPAWVKSGNKAVAAVPQNNDAYATVQAMVKDTEAKMPFSEKFWKKPPVIAKPSGVKGFICALPMEWTKGENNHPDMNMILLTQIDKPTGIGTPTTALAANTPADKAGAVG
jgi:phospholipase D1/2